MSLHASKPGDDARDGVHQPIHILADRRRLPCRAGQPDRRHLGYAGGVRMTSQGQAILLFFGITGRIIPIMAPIALGAISLGCDRCNTPRWSPPADRFNVLTEHITQRFATS